MTGVGTIGTGDDALVWHETTTEQRQVEVLGDGERPPEQVSLIGILVGSEPDGNGNRLSAYAPTGVDTTIDGFTQVSQLTDGAVAAPRSPAEAGI